MSRFYVGNLYKRFVYAKQTKSQYILDFLEEIGYNCITDLRQICDFAYFSGQILQIHYVICHIVNLSLFEFAIFVFTFFGKSFSKAFSKNDRIFALALVLAPITNLFERNIFFDIF